jgi:hypothetical protein
MGRGHDLDIELVAVPALREAPVPAPRALWLFAAAMATSLAVAAFGGLALGILAATGRGIARSRWTEIVQAHGGLQLWGWVAVFVVALSFEFIVRFNQQSPFSFRSRAVILGLLVVGSILFAIGQVLGQLDRQLATAGSALAVVGSLGFGWLIFRIRTQRPRVDLNTFYFRAGAAWLALAAIATLVSSAHMDSGVVPLEETRFWVEVFIRGFVMNVTIAVALHAFPGHLDLPAPSERTQGALFEFLNVSLLVWVAGTGGFGLPGIAWLQRAGDIAFVGTLLFATVAFSLVRSVLSLTRSSARYQVMVPIAWAGLLAYAVGLAIQAAPGQDLTLYQTGAVRHMFLLGFMAPLMIAMAHIVLTHFGVGRVVWQNWLTAAFVLLIIAWPLRVVPPLLDRSVSSTTEGLMGIAGTLAAMGLALAAVVAARNALAIASRSAP